MKFIPEYRIPTHVQLKAVGTYDRVTAEVKSSLVSHRLCYVNQTHTDIVKRLFKPMENAQDMLLHAVVGISGEAGELLDAVKKHVYYDKELDIENVIEELGDLHFYIEAVTQILQTRMETIKAHNIDKLRRRYPEGAYSNEQATTRADKADELHTPIASDVARDVGTAAAAQVTQSLLEGGAIMRSVHLK